MLIDMEWRDWNLIMDALPPVRGRTVLDLGCGSGERAKDLAVRGARVIGLDLNEDLLRVARSRNLPGSEFHKCDLRQPLPPDWSADGLWCSFAAAYFPDLRTVLKNWGDAVKPGGWLALTEIDDLFGHEPVEERTKSSLAEYARQAFAAGRYDFHMGRKMASHLRHSGFAVASTFTIRDLEFSFQGSAPPEVVESWRKRFDRMALLRDFCGSDFNRRRDDFLKSLKLPQHRASAKVICCIAFAPGRDVSNEARRI